MVWVFLFLGLFALVGILARFQKSKPMVGGPIEDLGHYQYISQGQCLVKLNVPQFPTGGGMSPKRSSWNPVLGMDPTNLNQMLGRDFYQSLDQVHGTPDFWAIWGSNALEEFIEITHLTQGGDWELDGRSLILTIPNNSLESLKLGLKSLLEELSPPENLVERLEANIRLGRREPIQMELVGAYLSTTPYPFHHWPRGKWLITFLRAQRTRPASSLASEILEGRSASYLGNLWENLASHYRILLSPIVLVGGSDNMDQILLFQYRILDPKGRLGLLESILPLGERVSGAFWLGVAKDIPLSTGEKTMEILLKAARAGWFSHIQKLPQSQFRQKLLEHLTHLAPDSPAGSLDIVDEGNGEISSPEFPNTPN